MGEAHIISVWLNAILAFFEWLDTEYPIWKFIFAFSIIILFCYLCWDLNEEGIHYVVTERVPITMRKVINPFTFDMSHQDTNSQGVKCTISTQKDSYILLFWGVDGYDLFIMLGMNWVTMKYNLLEDHNTFKSKCLAASPIIRLPVGQQSLDFIPPSPLRADGKPKPLIFLPLVIVMLLEDDVIENIEEPFIFMEVAVVDIQAVFNKVTMGNVPILPISDKHRAPSVLGIYVKETHSPTIGVVKKVYDGSLFSENVNGQDIAICIACCQRTVNTVIFPCLHASLCTLCYFQCEICPNCRGPVFYYFTTGPLTEIPQTSP